MSLSTDVLAKGTPTRLVCRAGRWVLELTRLEAVDRDVFQPRLTRLEGAESILAVLRRSDDGQLLATGAAQIMRSPRGEEDRAFEVNEGDWVPSDSALPTRQQQLAESQGSEAGRAIAELRAELAVLRASHARLRDRVVALEATQSGLAQANLRLPRGSRTQRRRSEPPPAFSEVESEAEALAGNPGFAATQASPAQATAAVAVARAAATAAPVAVGDPAPPPTTSAHQSFEELAKSLGGEQPLPILALPNLRSLSECLATLMETAPTLEQSSKATPLESLVGAQVCKLLDDAGRERGAIILDLRAAVLLGAALLAVPRDEALRQLNENDPSEDALLATSEICNNLTGPVNAVAGNEHVRSTALTGAEVRALPKARARLDLAVDGGWIVFTMF